MKKLITAIALLNLCFTCATPKTDEGKTEDTSIGLSKTEQLIEHIEPIKPEQVTAKLLFTANGSEPGWYAEFYNTKLKLVLNYGKDSVLITDNFEDVTKNQTFAYTKSNVGSQNNAALAIAITNKPCIAEGSGQTMDKTVLIKYNNVTFKGCGSITSTKN